MIFHGIVGHVFYFVFQFWEVSLQSNLKDSNFNLLAKQLPSQNSMTDMQE